LEKRKEKKRKANGEASVEVGVHGRGGNSFTRDRGGKKPKRKKLKSGELDP